MPLLNECPLTSTFFSPSRTLPTVSFSPAVLLEAFVREVGAALTTVTSLTLHVEDSAGNRTTGAVLMTALASLFSACPVLRSFGISGRLSPALMCTLAGACPLLSTLRVMFAGADLPYLQASLLLQPTLLPNITTLTFEEPSPGFQLPDISSNHTVHALELRTCSFVTHAHWLSLPPNLRTLSCSGLEGGPPAAVNGRASLASLRSLQLDLHVPVSLHVLAQVLRAAPSLQDITPMVGDSEGDTLAIHCHLKQSTAAKTIDDLALLQRTTQGSALRTAFICIDCTEREDVQGSSSLCGTIADLQCMPGTTRCGILGLTPGELAPLLGLFPDLTVLEIGMTDGFSDVELQDVAVCTSLTTLALSNCDSVTPMGLLLLCQRLPRLRKVTCHACAELGRQDLEGCVELLRKTGSKAELHVLEEEDE